MRKKGCRFISMLVPLDLLLLWDCGWDTLSLAKAHNSVKLVAHARQLPSRVPCLVCIYTCELFLCPIQRHNGTKHQLDTCVCGEPRNKNQKPTLAVKMCVLMTSRGLVMVVLTSPAMRLATRCVPTCLEGKSDHK